MLFIPWSTTKDGVLGSSADLGQPGNVLALTGSLPGESFDDFFASLPEKWKLASSSSHKCDWLSFGGLLVNLSVLHHERVISCCVLRFVATWTSNALSGVWFGPHPTSTWSWPTVHIRRKMPSQRVPFGSSFRRPSTRPDDTRTSSYVYILLVAVFAGHLHVLMTQELPPTCTSACDIQPFASPPLTYSIPFIF
jgi:hypothetical protein